MNRTDRFLAHHSEHAHLYDALVELAYRLAEDGNHDVGGFYARLIAHREPALRPFLADLRAMDFAELLDDAGRDVTWLEEAA